MMIIVINGSWDKEILKRQVLEYRVKDTSIFEGDFGTSARSLDSILCTMEAMNSRKNTNSLIILSNKGQNVVINNLCYYRIPEKLVIIAEITLKLYGHVYSLFSCSSHTVNIHRQEALSYWYVQKEIV